MKTQQYILYVALLFTGIACTKEANTAKSSDNGKGGSLARFALAGNCLYVVDDYSLKVYEISDTAAPQFKGEELIGWRIETIFPYGNKLFIGSASAFYIYSLDDPYHPVKESSVSHLRSCDPIVTQGNTAYVTLRAGNTCGGTASFLMVYDVTDIKNPELKKQIPLTGPFGLGVQDDALYVCDGNKGLVVFDIKKPHQPALLSRIEDGNIYYDVIPYNGILIAYLQNGVSFFDISKPQQPVLLSSLKN